MSNAYRTPQGEPWILANRPVHKYQFRLHLQLCSSNGQLYLFFFSLVLFCFLLFKFVLNMYFSGIHDCFCVSRPVVVSFHEYDKSSYPLLFVVMIVLVV